MKEIITFIIKNDVHDTFALIQMNEKMINEMIKMNVGFNYKISCLLKLDKMNKLMKKLLK